MGHGFADGDNTYLKTMDEPFHISENCKNIFSTEPSKLRKKPKLFLAQMCRSKKYIIFSNLIIFFCH